MRIVKLEVSNVKRLSAVSITPKGSKIVLAGKNGAGKTSCLDSIEMALAGGKSIPAEPVRRGARKGYIVLDLGEIVVERTFTSKGTSLVVRNADGVEQKSPQALLDSLCGRIAFDPLTFARAKPADQDKMLKDMLGLDFSELDGDHATVYAERTNLNRDLKTKEALYGAMPEHKGVPKAEVSVKELADKRDAAREATRVRQSAEESCQRQEQEVERALAEVEKLKVQLRTAEDKYRTETEKLDMGRAMLEALEPVTDTTELDAQLATAEETNAKVRANLARAAAFVELEKLEKKIADATEALAIIDDKKQKMLAEAEFPVPGLGFDDVGPTLNGVPLEQASQAEKVKLSCAIGLKMNPQLKILLIREGVFLDDESMAFLTQLAEEHDAQIWLELVKTDDPSAIVIEDGMVAEAAATTAAE